MPVSFGSATSVAEATVANTTYTAPSGIVNGDLLLIWHFEFVASGSVPTPTPPTGFATPASGVWPMTATWASTAIADVWLWQKIASAESGNYATTHTSCVTRGLMIRATGNDTVNPLDGLTQAQAFVPPSTTTYTGFTTTANGDLIIALNSDDNDSGTYPATTSGGNIALSLGTNTPGEAEFHAIQTSAGALGTITNANRSGGSSPWMGVLLAVKSPAAAARPVFPVFLPRQLGPRAVGPTFFAALQPAPGSAPTGIQNQSVLAATLTFAGSQSLATIKQLAAVLSFTGSLIKAVTKQLSAALTFTGSVAKSIGRPLPAALSFTGALAAGHAFAQALAAALTFTGSQARQIAKKLTAILSFTGARTLTVGKLLAAGLSFAGTQARSTASRLTAALTFTGAQTKLVAKKITAGLSFTGAFTTQAVHFFTQTFTAALTFTGARTLQTGKALSAALTFTGKRTLQTIKQLAAVLSFTGSQTKQVVQKLTAAVLSFAGALIKARPAAFTAALSFSGKRTLQTGKVYAATLSSAGKISKAVSLGIAASLTFAGTIRKAIVKKLSGALSFAGNIIRSGGAGPPAICYPTTVLIVPYSSAPTFAPTASGVTMRPYSSTTTIPSHNTSTSLASYGTSPTLASHNTSSGVVAYTSAVTHFNTCND